MNRKNRNGRLRREKALGQNSEIVDRGASEKKDDGFGAFRRQSGEKSEQKRELVLHLGHREEVTQAVGAVLRFGVVYSYFEGVSQALLPFLLLRIWENAKKF